MNKLSKVFAGGKALIPFIVCGDPDLWVTEELVCAMAEAGADLIELGIPFSDPTAECEASQSASLRALAGGVTTDKVFDMVRRVREECAVPLMFVTYANVVFSYGTERFLDAAAELGIAGLILPDVPYEEKEEFAAPCRERGISLISGMAPASAERMAMIVREAEGFVYCTPSQGGTDLSAMASLVKRENPGLPCAAPAGISGEFDGMVLSSDIVELCAKYGAGCVSRAADYVRRVKAELKNM